MASELHEQLQSVLGSAYKLQHELGGGGMSRVFLAHEPALGRDVVVKVLHPELASGVNIDRFKREIQLAAQLQHPHVVPILAAGEMNGLPYLTMPYVAGRSLRERLGETPMLPLDEAVDVLRDVARALAYAHGRGVIHRDIKPDNVLLAEGSATVTDFGVAKAISAARGGADRPEPGARNAGDDGARNPSIVALTSVGMSIGTPTYMAPEQASGDPSTDHRADIYAWGVMAYELLAGRPPFTAKSPHKLLAAHMSEAPEPVTDRRPDCPKALSALVMHCLAKDPEQRPQSANELVRALAEVSTPSGVAHDALPAISLATRRTLTKALALYAAAFILVAALAQAAVVLVGLPDWVLPGTLVVMALGLPVILFTGFVHHGSRVARTIAVRAPGGSVTGSSTMARLAVKASPHVTWKRTAIGGALAVGVFALLVVGYMVLRAMGIGPAGSLFAKGVISERDRLLVTDFEAPPSDSMLGGVVSEGVRTGLGQSASITLMEPDQVAAALQRMQRPAGSRLELPLARELAEREGVKAIVDGEVAPVGASGSYILTLRLLAASGGAPLASFQEPAKDAADLIPAIDRATRKLRGRLGESLKRVRETMPLERATTTSLAALRKYSEGMRAQCLRAVASPVAQLSADGHYCLGMVALGGGRLKEYQTRRAAAYAIDSARGVTGTGRAALLDSIRTDIWFRERRAEAVRRLDAFLARKPLREYPRNQQPYLPVAGLYALAGRPDRARAVLAQYATDVGADTARLRLQSAGMHSALGEIAVAEGKYDVAIREFAASDTSYDGAPMPCAVCALPQLARAYDLAGQTDRAIETFERYVESKYAFRASSGTDALYLAGTYKRLGELYEAKGDRQKAASYYARFIDAWKDADPELQPMVAEVRRRLAALGDIERR